MASMSTMAEAVQMLTKYVSPGFAKDQTNVEVAKQLIQALKK